MRELRYFVALADTLHYGRAAERLNVAQPALSRAIKNLEAKLGLPLFFRSSREVVLTPAGAALLEDARRVLLDGDRMIERARALAVGEEGSLQLGYVPAIEDTVQEMIECFAAEHPLISIGQRREYNSALRQAVAARELDAAVVFTEAVVPDDLVVLPFGSRPLVCAVGQRHPLARRTTVRPDEIVQFPVPFLPIPDGEMFRRVAEQAFAVYGLQPHWSEVSSAIARHPAVLSNSDEYVWLQTAEVRHASDVVLIEISPPLVVDFELVSSAANAGGALRLLLESVADPRGPDDAPVA